MKRTNVVLDEKLIEEAKKLSGLRYTREVIHEAVRIFVKNRRRKRILELAGTVQWDGDLAAMRQDRNQDLDTDTSE